MNLRWNQTAFDFEDFDEEIVLVNLQSGVYYTVKDAGPALLRAFRAGATDEALLAAAEAAGGTERRQAAGAFIAQLVEEGILVETDGAEPATPSGADLGGGAFVLEKFDDVSDLIKLDPIHDVSDLGWPHKA
jgi:hypothetical protein